MKGKKATTYNMGNGIRQSMLKEFGVNVVNEPVVIFLILFSTSTVFIGLKGISFSQIPLYLPTK